MQEIAERAAAVKDLESQLLGLHQIFLDMAVLVEAQGEMLDNIESMVRSLSTRSLTLVSRLLTPLSRCSARRLQRQMTT